MAKPSSTFTPDDLEEIRRLRAAGVTYASIGKQFGTSHGVIWALLNKTPAPVKQVKPTIKETLSGADCRAYVTILYTGGLSIPAIARIAKVPHPYIHEILKESGIRLRPAHLGGARRCVEAIQLVNQAIREGELSRGPCEECGATGVDKNGRPLVVGHHDDYNFPLRVRWLCALHHRQWHQSNMAIMATEEKVEEMRRQLRRSEETLQRQLEDLANSLDGEV